MRQEIGSFSSVNQSLVNQFTPFGSLTGEQNTNTNGGTPVTYPRWLYGEG
jgi:hypothetical protein